MAKRKSFEEFRATALENYYNEKESAVTEIIRDNAFLFSFNTYQTMENVTTVVKDTLHLSDGLSTDPDIKLAFSLYGKKKALSVVQEIVDDLSKSIAERIINGLVNDLKDDAKEIEQNNYLPVSDAGHDDIALLFTLLINPFIAQRLTPKERIILTGACIDFMTTQRKSEISTLIDYQRGIEEEDISRMLIEECSDEYIVYSRREKKLYKTKLVEEYSFWSLLKKFLPQTVIDSINKHPQSKSYLKVTQNDGCDYETAMQTKKADMNIMATILRHKENKLLDRMKPGKFYEKEVRRSEDDSKVAENAQRLAETVSRLKKKYDI